MASLGDLIVRVGANISDFESSMGRVSSHLGKVANEAERTFGGFSRFGQQMASFGTQLSVAVTLPMVGLGTAALKTAGDLEQASVAFKTMLGSSDAAAKHLKELQAFALKTPFEFADLLVASKRLQALGFDAREVIPTLRSVGDAAAALGLGAEGINRITLALGQMRAKGTIQAEEMRQLAEAGIPAWQILAKTLNTDVAGAMKLVEQRAVSSAKAVPALLEGINSRFGGLMEQQSKTFLGLLSNLKDKVFFTLADIGKSLLPLGKQVMENYLDPMLAKVQALAKGFSELRPGTQATILGFAGLAAALPPVIAALGFTIQGIGVFGKAIHGVLPLITSPTGIAIALGTVLVGGIALGIKSLHDLNTSLEETYAKFEKFKSGKVLDGVTKWSREITPDLAKEIEKQIGTDKFTIKAPDASAGAKAAAEAAQKMAQAYSTLGLETNKFREIEAALASLWRAHRSLNEKVPETTTAYAVLKREFDSGRITFGEFQRALVRIGAEFEKVNNDKKWTIPEQAPMSMRELEAAINASVTAMNAIPRTSPFADLLNPVSTFTQSILEADQGTRRLAEAFRAMGTEAQLSIGLTDRMLKDLGIKTERDLAKELDKAREAMERTREENRKGERAWRDVMEAERKYLEIKRETQGLTKKEEEQLKKLDAALGNHSKTVDKSAGAWKRLGQQVSTILTDLSRGIADAIVDAKSWGEVFTSVAKEIAKAIIRWVIEEGIKKMLDWLKKAMKDTDSWASSIGGIFKKLGSVFGGGSSAASSVFSAAADNNYGSGWKIPGIGDSGGGVSMASSLGGTVGGLVGGIASAITGVIGVFQNAHQETSLNAIEHNTRYSMMYLGERADGGILGVLFKIDEELAWGSVAKALEAIKDKFLYFADVTMASLDTLKGMGGTGGGNNVTINVTTNDPKAAAQETVRLLKQMGIVPAT